MNITFCVIFLESKPYTSGSFLYDSSIVKVDNTEKSKIFVRVLPKMIKEALL